MIRLWRSWRALPVWLRDAVLALVLTVYGQVELLIGAEQLSGLRPLQHLAFAVITASVAQRRRRPVAAAAICAGGLAAQTLVGEAPAAAGYLALLVVTYSVAQYADRRRDALLGLVVVLAAIGLYPFVTGEVSVADEVVNAAIPLVVWAFARLARERLDRAVAAEQETMAARAQAREEELTRGVALAAERRRIAREMHDVVAHAVTLMLLHTDAAQASLAGREPATGQALDVVLDAGRTALADLHRLLRLLREGDEAEDAPGSLADLDGLVEATRTAGLDVVLAVTGPARPLPAALQATAYRVVQEALTNALKHAAAARVHVALHYGPNAVEIEVTDDGTGRPTGAPGFGLAGIRERVALFDGAVTAGPREDGSGWQVCAVLPVPEPATV